MDIAQSQPVSASDLNFNPARFPLERLRDFARKHWGLAGEFVPLDGERDQNHRVTGTDGQSHVLKVSAAGESQGAVEFQVAALRHLERHAPDLPVPRIVASKPGNDLGAPSPGLSAGPERELARPPSGDHLPDDLRPPR